LRQNEKVKTSLFDLFKIGIGPSSSHTVGPMRAAQRFAAQLASEHLRPARIRVELFGSLALTGKGHSTDRAILLGLAGELPDRIEPAEVEGLVARIREQKRIGELQFDEARDLIFHADLVLPGHPNGMRFTAFDADRRELRVKVYYSIGGGFVTEEGSADHTAVGSLRGAVPYPFESGAELLDHALRHERTIPEIMLANESAWRAEAEVRDGILRIWRVMQDCVERGLAVEGVLPGGLHVKRRGPSLRRKLEAQGVEDSLAAMDWVNLYAIAVNEENAAGGRVVTAPTNGAAGVIPAVAHYYMKFCRGDREGILRYFLPPAAIGVTCDPIAGLVQIPCIERNAFGAVKAVNAARMAMRETEGHLVSLDQVIKTMYQTGLDMQSKYKETSLAGLAVNVVEC
jgi:L-serine dehydratase